MGAKSRDMAAKNAKVIKCDIEAKKARQCYSAVATPLWEKPISVIRNTPGFQHLSNAQIRALFCLE